MLVVPYALTGTKNAKMALRLAISNGLVAIPVTRSGLKTLATNIVRRVDLGLGKATLRVDIGSAP